MHLSRGYILEGFLPVRIAFPSLASMFLGQVDISEQILLDSFVNSLNSVESQLLKTCFKTEQFSTGIQTKIIDCLSRFGLRETPTPNK